MRTLLLLWILLLSSAQVFAQNNGKPNAIYRLPDGSGYIVVYPDRTEKLSTVKFEERRLDTFRLPVLPAPVMDPRVTGVKLSSVEVEGADTLIFVKTEIAPAVDWKIWTAHLNAEMATAVRTARSKGVPAGSYRVPVEFLVEKSGQIAVARTRITSTDPGYGLAEAAVSIVNRGPLWSPAEQNGRKVRCLHTVTFVFEIPE